MSPGKQQLAQLRGRLDDLLEPVDGLAAPLGARRTQSRKQHLLHQAHLTVDGTLEDAQVLGAQSRRGKLGGGSHDAGVDLAVPLDAAHLMRRHELVLLELFEQRGIRAGHAQDLFTHELPFSARGDQVGFAQPLPRYRRRARWAALQLATDDLERQVLVALQGQHAHETPEVLLREEAIAGLGAPRGDEMLLLQVAQLADGDVRELVAQPLDHRADGEQLLVADVEEQFRVLVHGTMKVSLYLPTCSSSPSTSVCRSVRTRLT